MQFTQADLAALIAVLRRAAAAEVMPRFRDLPRLAVRAKTSALDVVTEADTAAERAIEAALTALYPGCLVVGEEGSETAPGRLDALADAPLAFVVDPVDGTRNFASGLPLFAVMAAAIVKGRIVAGAILDPVTDTCAAALAGEGAFLEQADGARAGLRVAAPVPVEAMRGVVALRFLDEPEKSQVARRLARVADADGYGCAGHEYRLLAGGHRHFSIYTKMMPWDHAPGVLLHAEAGGHAMRFDGAPYDVAVRTGGLIAAPDRPSAEAVRAALLGG